MAYAIYQKYFENTTTESEMASEFRYKGRGDFSENSVESIWKGMRIQDLSYLAATGIQRKILGGCIDSIYDIFDNSRFEGYSISFVNNMIYSQSLKDWKNKILLLETSQGINRNLNYIEK